jgi:hypothetical protein
MYAPIYLYNAKLYMVGIIQKITLLVQNSCIIDKTY